MIPSSIIRIWFLGLFSWVLLGVGIYLGHEWYRRAWSYDYNLQRSYFDPHIGYNHETVLLVVAVALLLWVEISRFFHGSVAKESAGCERIFWEKASGGRWDRPDLIRLEAS